MGRNAQRRIRQRQKLAMTPAQKLAARMRQVATLQQFEEIIAAADADHRGTMRKTLAPLLRPGLPCCGPAQLAALLERHGRMVEWEHTERCPSRNVLVLPEIAAPASGVILDQYGDRLTRAADGV